MQKVPVHRKARTPYWLRFSLVMLGFGGFTSAFVMVVLPKRFILQSGLVESGITFPTEALPFESAGRHLVVQPTYPASLPDNTPGIGPAEQMWSTVLEFLEADDPEGALPIFVEYLENYPEDLDVWREYVVALRQAGRVEEVEQVLERLVREGDPTARVTLARFLRDKGDVERSLPIYRELLAENPDDLELLHELARSLVWTEQYDEAAVLYRGLLGREPRSLTYRFEYAQVLYWKGEAEEAYGILMTYPSADSGWIEVRPLLNEIAPQVIPPVLSLSQRIQRYLAQGDRTEAKRLFERLLSRTPRDSERWMEWVDFLQYELLDLEAARGALMHRATKIPLESDDRFRLAQLHLWTRHEEEARTELLALVQADPHYSDAWVLLGDMYRWDGNLLEARHAYERALIESPDHEDAIAGNSAISDLVESQIALREPAGAEPSVLYFRDSDDFSRLDLSARVVTRRGTNSIEVQAGFRHLDGPGFGGNNAAESGPFAEVEVARWWRLGTVRTSVSAGVERFNTFGAEPAISAAVEVPDANGYALAASWDHRPAYQHTVTLASMLGSVRADNFNLSVYRGLSEKTSLAASAGLVSLRGGGDGSVRAVGAVTLTNRLSEILGLGLTSRILGHSNAAPTVGDRRLFWDPSVFWTNQVIVELRTPEGSDWILFGRLSPGFAIARERDLFGTSVVPQFGTEAGATYNTGRLSFQSDLAYYRGRAGDYSSILLNFRMFVRP